jgi:hypothetical protein
MYISVVGWKIMNIGHLMHVYAAYTNFEGPTTLLQLKKAGVLLLSLIVVYFLLVFIIISIFVGQSILIRHHDDNHPTDRSPESSKKNIISESEASKCSGTYLIQGEQELSELDHNNIINHQ